MMSPSGFFWVRGWYLHASVFHAVISELIGEFEEVERTECIFDAQILRQVGVRVEVLDASLLDLPLLQTLDYPLVGVELQFFLHLLQFLLLSPLSLQLFRGLLLFERTHDQNLAVRLHIFFESLLILRG